MTSSCKDILSVKNVSSAFKKENKALTSKIVSCFFTCYKFLFTKWSVVTYYKYPAKFIEEIAEYAFADGVLKFSAFAASNDLYEGAALKTILFNFYKNELRSNLRNQQRLNEKERKIIASLSSTSSLSATESNNEQFYLTLEKAINQMNVEDKKIIKWRHYELKTNEEIADLLDITVASATNRIYRCMQRLRQITQSINANNGYN